jgi:transposase, IS30 family
MLVKRDLYRLLMSQGLTNSEACRRVGIGRKTGCRWTHGRRVPKSGGGNYFYPPIVDLKPERSERYLSPQERVVIADGVQAGRSSRSIARELGRAVSTVCRELSRNRDEQSGQYLPHAAQQAMVTRKPRPKQRRVETNAELRQLIQDRLDKKWSPEQIVNTIRLEHPNQPELHIAVETLYQALYAFPAVLSREAHVVLRTRRRGRRRRNIGQRTARFVSPMIPLKDRPLEADDRTVAGHWEGDLITGAENKSAIGTLVERTTGYVMLVHFVGRHDATQLRDALTEKFNALPIRLRRSLTWDQGIEMARHHETSAATNMPVFFCQPRSPWQRGTNENTNGLLRGYFPKGTDLSIYTPEDLKRAAEELNNRPRKRLRWKTPAQLFDNLKTLIV